MSNLAWIALILFAALVSWALITTLAHRFLTVDETVLSVFKLMLRHRDIDPAAIPDAALIDIIVLKIVEAKSQSEVSVTLARRPDGWRRHLLRMLDAAADQIEAMLKNGVEQHAGLDTTRILLRYVVVEPRYPPAMSVEQFWDAAGRGTLYAELDERISKREIS